MKSDLLRTVHQKFERGHLFRVFNLVATLSRASHIAGILTLLNLTVAIGLMPLTPWRQNQAPRVLPSKINLNEAKCRQSKSNRMVTHPTDELPKTCSINSFNVLCPACGLLMLYLLTAIDLLICGLPTLVT